MQVPPLEKTLRLFLLNTLFITVGACVCLLAVLPCQHASLSLHPLCALVVDVCRLVSLRSATIRASFAHLLRCRGAQACGRFFSMLDCISTGTSEVPIVQTVTKLRTRTVALSAGVAAAAA